MSSIAGSTSSASPTSSTSSPSSARTPLRNSSWSSTRNTRGRETGVVTSSQRSGAGVLLPGTS